MSNKFTAITSGESQIPVYDKEAHSALSGKQDKLTIYGYNGHITHINSSAISAAKAIEAGYAGYAYNDSNGHSITSTYVPNSAINWHENEFVYLTGVSGYPISAANAEYAQEAGEAYNDTNGHAIHTTYAPNSAFNFKNSTACSGVSGRPIYASEANYAYTAGRAANDANGKYISTTYAPNSAFSFNSVDGLTSVSGQMIYAQNAGYATTASFAQSDINGNNIGTTYQKKLGYSGNSDHQGIYLENNALFAQQYDGQTRLNQYGYINGSTLLSHADKQRSIYAGIKGQNWSVTAGPSLMSLSGYISAHEGSWSGGSGSVTSPSGTIYVDGSNIESTDKVIHEHITDEYDSGSFECSDGWVRDIPIHYNPSNKTVEIIFSQVIPAGTVVTMENNYSTVVLTLTTTTATNSVKFTSDNGNISWWEQGDYAYIHRHDNVSTTCTVIQRLETKQIANVMVESELAFDSGNNITAYNGSAFCGSALPISAGPGIKLELVNNTLVASTNGYVWTSASLFHTNSPVTQTTYTLSDSCSNYDKLEVDFYDVDNKRTVMDCPIPPNLASSGTRGGYFSVVPQDTSTTSLIWFKAFNWSAVNTTWTCYCSEISAKGGSSSVKVNANQPANPPKVMNIIGWKRVGGN